MTSSSHSFWILAPDVAETMGTVVKIRPRENPTKANLLAEYGSMCGTAIRPPIDAMLTIEPFRRYSMPGRIAKVVCMAP
jgi:hypothetical protein